MDESLLDTDILSEIIKLRDIHVRARAAAYARQHGSLAFSAITRYEITRGYLSQQATAQLARFEVFCQRALVFALTDSIFDRAAHLWATAHRGGHPRNDVDLLIAATAIEHSRVLVTGNSAHFAWISGLRLDDWRQP